MKFRVDFTPAKSEAEITHGDKVLLLGSCFAENIGKKLQEHGFNATVNPGGIMFNPASLHLFLLNVLDRCEVAAHRFLERGGRFFSYEFHSSVSASSDAGLVEAIKRIYEDTYKALCECHFIFLSFGSAHVYLGEEGNIATNCHKQPSSCFTKEILEPESIAAGFEHIIKKLRKLNRNAHVVFTLSPVKYLRDGLVENILSKSVLRMAIHRLGQHGQGAYFPAYELVTDDLRDYRFYKEDLAHPNEQAIGYVWEKFGETYFSAHTRKLNVEMLKLQKMRAHRPLHNHPEEEARFAAAIAAQEQKIRALDPRLLPV